MQLKGQYNFAAKPLVVWGVLHDPSAIARALPGVEALEPIDGEENAYRARAKLQVAAIGGTYDGELRLSELEPPSSYRMAVSGEGQNSRIQGEVAVTLNENAAGTNLLWGAEIQVSGLLARVGQRLIPATANMLSKRFFATLAEEISQRNG